MLKKLLKYDLKWCYKPLIVFYVLALFFAIITRVIESFEQSLILVIIDKICSGITIALIINILINCFMRNWARFIKNVYKDESYLTHTLPVTKSKIYLSKILTAIIILFTSFVVIIACIAIVVLNENSWSLLKTSLEDSAILLNCSISSLIITLVIIVFLEFLLLIMSGIVGIIIGQKSNNSKIVKSIIIGFGIYMIFSIMSLVILYVVGLLNSDIMSIFNDIEVKASVIRSIMMMWVFVYTIYICIVYFVGNKLLNKGVNVD